jgi:hypothetical protein
MQFTDRQERKMDLQTNSDLLAAIEELQKKKEMQESLISNTFDDIKESLKPGNIAKSVFHKITNEENALSLGLKVGGTIAAAIITKKLISAYKEHHPTEKEESNSDDDSHTMLGNLIRATASNILISNIPAIRAYATSAFENLFSNKETRIINKKSPTHES